MKLLYNIFIFWFIIGLLLLLLLFILGNWPSGIYVLFEFEEFKWLLLFKLFITLFDFDIAELFVWLVFVIIFLFELDAPLYLVEFIDFFFLFIFFVCIML